MRNLINIVEQILLEQFSKGSTGILNNKKIVDNLADAVKRDAKYNSSGFPQNFSREVRKMSNEDIAKWFLKNLDDIEAEGYEGVVYSRNGVNNLWFVNNYIKRNHNWEDIAGTASMMLSQWYYLKNRNLLDPLHNDIGKFNGIRDLGSHMVMHYADKLTDYKEQLAAQAQKRLIRAYKIVDNDDYRIYITFNRAANISYGLGTTWCTTSSAINNPYFNSYATKALIFQLFPYEPAEVELKDRVGREIKGKERYQFDAGGPWFMNIADVPPNKEMIRDQYPYLYDDLKTSLENEKGKLQDHIDQLVNDPVLNKDVYGKVHPYNVQEEIEKLKRLLQVGWFTDEKRPPTPIAIDNDQPRES